MEEKKNGDIGMWGQEFISGQIKNEMSIRNQVMIRVSICTWILELRGGILTRDINWRVIISVQIIINVMRYVRH